MAAKPSPLTELKRAISPISEIIEEAREGRMFILVDEEDRENEGDLVIPAQFATPAQVNFMAKHGRGLICLSLTPERAEVLGLDPMTPRNQTRMGTAFTVSIEAREGVSTGISAHDRALTIATAIDPTKDRRDIVSPGHVFPLTAREGGVLVRAGHTEASVDISRQAGLNPSAVICEIMNDDGTMARLPELVAFAQFHNLKIGAIDELIAYRRVNERLVEKVAEAPFEVRGGTGFKLVVFRNKLDGVEHAALVKGEISADKPTLVRVHRIDFAADVMGGYGARAGLIDRAVAEIDAEGAGIVVLLRDLVADALSRRLSGEPLETETDDILRVIGVGSQILRELGVGRMTVLSDTPQKLVGLDGYGLSIDGWRGFKS
ncbi:3,4-dihydroxy-2-butanone-4-phosphate synthase [Terricaulis sp.]|uniref:3,4-dihydroxy-2-butanone-4-phosphate synthase n=1 Tax=Terricaulis sp. TaxID=2768686 RepID=UPI002AC4D35C|nr:3,4-dihydroxy-2-butanone-4-phosphate synthase [Terricaulis sp.]MDZ4691846.1 3,4-dihydroxy-2-butanone-4-phosphate synthase [Terricaulis sp.]